MMNTFNFYMKTELPLMRIFYGHNLLYCPCRAQGPPAISKPKALPLGWDMQGLQPKRIVSIVITIA